MKNSVPCMLLTDDHPQNGKLSFVFQPDTLVWINGIRPKWSSVKINEVLMNNSWSKIEEDIIDYLLFNERRLRTISS